MAIFSVTWQRQKNRLKITLANINEAPCFLPLICLQSQKMSELPASWRTMCCFIQGSDNTDLFSSSSSFFLQQTFVGSETSPESLDYLDTWMYENLSCDVPMDQKPTFCLRMKQKTSGVTFYLLLNDSSVCSAWCQTFW